MERKLIRQGRNALTVTLPAKWLRERKLIAGKQVYLEEQNDRLTITSARTVAESTTTIDMTGAERSMVYHAIMGKYIEGFDRIAVLHDCPGMMQEVGTKLLGMIIEEHGPTKTVYRSVIAVPEETFDAVLRRAAHILLEQARAIEALTLGAATADDVKDHEQLLDYNILYCLRFLNKYERSAPAYKYFLICATLEHAGDQLSRISRFIGRDKQLGRIVRKGIEEYTKILFTSDLKRMYTSLRALRTAIPQKGFVHGIAYEMAETLYNYIGYLVQKE